MISPSIIFIVIQCFKKSNWINWIKWRSRSLFARCHAHTHKRYFRCAQFMSFFSTNNSEFPPPPPPLPNPGRGEREQTHQLINLMKIYGAVNSCNYKISNYHTHVPLGGLAGWFVDMLGGSTQPNSKDQIHNKSGGEGRGGRILYDTYIYLWLPKAWHGSFIITSTAHLKFQTSRPHTLPVSSSPSNLVQTHES